MSDDNKNTYEGLFLFPQAQSSNLKDTIDHLTTILDRADAEIITMKKWGERNLAYTIKKFRRGLYILTYFKAPGEGIARIERDCNLSETVLRYIITRADHLTEEEINSHDDRIGLETEMKLKDEEDKASEKTESTPEPASEEVADEVQPAAETETAIAVAVEEAPTESADEEPKPDTE